MKPVKIKRDILQYREGQFINAVDIIVSEYPVTIKINNQEFVTLVCTPEYIEDLVIGFLFSEGVIRTYEDIKEIWVQEKKGFAHIRVDNMNPYVSNFHSKRYITSCCGNGRQGFVFINDALTAKKMTGRNHVNISVEACFKLMNELEESAEVFQQTGGVHNAALCDVNRIILKRLDIGRHNALDKIYGHCVKNNISLRDKLVAFSGRISSEILLKVAEMGCEVILSKSAPTELALNVAEELGITTIGFIREDSLNVYTHPERIINLHPNKTID